MSQTVKLSIPGISCQHCVTSVVNETRGLPGVLEVKVDLASKTATYLLKDSNALAQVKATLEEIGYPPEG